MFRVRSDLHCSYPIYCTHPEICPLVGPSMYSVCLHMVCRFIPVAWRSGKPVNSYPDATVYRLACVGQLFRHGQSLTSSGTSELLNPFISLRTRGGLIIIESPTRGGICYDHPADHRYSCAAIRVTVIPGYAHGDAYQTTY